MSRSEQNITGITLGVAWQILLQEMHARQPGVIAGDAEELHQFRVALRKTRALLRLFRRFLPESAAIAREFAWLSDTLSPARDLDIVAEFLQRSADRRKLNERRALVVCMRELERQRAAQHRVLQTLLRGRRYRRLLSDWQGYIENCLNEVALPIVLHIRISTSRRVIALEQMLKLLQRLHRIDVDCTSATLHRLRIRCKRLRYLFDALPIAGDAEKFAAVRDALARLQRILGEHQDAVVIHAWLEQFAAPHTHNIALPQAWDAAAARQQLRARAALPVAWCAFIDACAEI